MRKPGKLYFFNLTTLQEFNLYSNLGSVATEACPVTTKWGVTIQMQECVCACVCVCEKKSYIIATLLAGG